MKSSSINEDPNDFRTGLPGETSPPRRVCSFEARSNSWNSGLHIDDYVNTHSGPTRRERTPTTHLHSFIHSFVCRAKSNRISASGRQKLKITAALFEKGNANNRTEDRAGDAHYKAYARTHTHIL